MTTEQALRKPHKRPAWYGGNKIPDSYLKRFCKAVEDAETDNLSYDLRLFLEGMK